jgi:DHA2 family multidrug resistance protein
LEVLDSTIVNVSLPQMAGNLGATSEEIGWVATGYILANVVVLPATAWLASRFGRKRYLAFSILLFTFSSVMCGMSTSLPMLVAWRIVQGAGGAALLSTAQATLREIFPRKDWAMTQAIYGLGIVAAPTIGPTVGGWITDNYNWHWIFLINLPIGIIAYFLVSGFLEDSEYSMETGKIDWLGLALLVVGLGCLQYGLEEGNSKLWFQDPGIVTCFVIVAIALPALVLWELSPKNPVPIVNVRVFRNPQLSAAALLFVVLGFGLYGGVFMYPLFAQNVLRLTPTQTGMVLFPGGLTTAVFALIAGRLTGTTGFRVQPRVLIVLGLGAIVCSMIWLASLPPTSGADDAQAALILRGAGMGFLFIPINLAAFSTLRGAEIAQGSSMLNLSRQLGGSLGIAILATFLTNKTIGDKVAMGRALVVGGNYQMTQRYEFAVRLFTSHGYPLANAQKAATSAIVQSLNGQASAVAFNQSFMLIGLAIILTAPAIFLLKTPKHPTSSSHSVDAH